MAKTYRADSIHSNEKSYKNAQRKRRNANNERGHSRRRANAMRTR